MVKHLFTEGTVPFTPNRPSALRLCRFTFTGVIAQGGATAAGAEVFHSIAPKRVKKNILMISPEPIFYRLPALNIASSPTTPSAAPAVRRESGDLVVVGSGVGIDVIVRRVVTAVGGMVVGVEVTGT
jgi:hypothetical protein